MIDCPKLTFLQLCIKKKMLPTRQIRFCCEVLKESQGAGTVTLTGVRRAESAKRAKRNEFELSGHKFSGTIDLFNRVRETDFACIGGKDKIIINPIIDWTDRDVWEFLNKVAKVPHCRLYDEGWRRIGCLFCPMASKREIAMMERRYPKYKAAVIRTIHRIREMGCINDYPDLSDEEVFDWWKGILNIKEYYAMTKWQQKLKF